MIWLIALVLIIAVPGLLVFFYFIVPILFIVLLIIVVSWIIVKIADAIGYGN